MASNLQFNRHRQVYQLCIVILQICICVIILNGGQKVDVNSTAKMENSKVDVRTNVWSGDKYLG